MGFAAVGFESSEAFLAHYEDQPGCLITDYRMAGMNGLELQETLLKRGCDLPLIMVTAYARTPLTIQAIKSGAVTLLDKPYDEDSLWQAIRKALTQDDQQRQTKRHLADVRRRLESLSEKERAVLDLLVAGKANKAMASQLEVSLRTIENRRRSIFSKLGVETVAELVALVFKSDTTP